MYVLSAASALYLPGIADFFFSSQKSVSRTFISLLIDFVDFFLLFSLHLKHMVSCSLCSMCSAFVHSVWVSAVASPFFLWLTNAAISCSLCHRYWTNPCCCVFSCHVWAVGSSVYVSEFVCLRALMIHLFCCLCVWVFGCQYVYVRCVICSVCSAVGAVAAVIPAVAAAVVKTAAAAVWVFPSLCPHPLHPAPSQVTSQKAHLTT